MSQKIILGTVRDAKNKNPLAFCAVTSLGTGKSTVTNDEGAFKLVVALESDSIVFTYIGYRAKQIPVLALMQSPVVFMEASGIELPEVKVDGNQSYLFKILDNCRKKIRASVDRHSKAYFVMQSDITGFPVEMMECYYNALTSTHKVKKLELKNGRIGLAETPDHGFFLSENTAHVLAQISLVEKNEYIPGLPFQLTEARLQKIYSLQDEFSFADDATYHIRFSPLEANGKFFNGEVWIDKNSYDLRKINLWVENTTTHPFEPVWHEDALSGVTLFFSETFSKLNDDWVPGNINFTCRLTYHANMEYRAKKINPGVDWGTDTAERVRVITTSGSYTFYDFDNGFILPYYDYGDGQSDYRKILSLPFNESFWSGDPHLLYTEKQKTALRFFNDNGVLINYRENNTMKTISRIAGEFFKGANLMWSDSNRLSFTKNNLDSLLKKDSLSAGSAFRVDQYKLKTQIFLDINPAGDSLSHFSAAVFDVGDSFYNLPPSATADCFLNILFDLAEIERRKMENVMAGNKLGIRQMDSVYASATAALNTQTAIFIKESESGQNLKGLLKWNQYAEDNLGIDNMKLFGLK